MACLRYKMQTCKHMRQSARIQPRHQNQVQRLEFDADCKVRQPNDVISSSVSLFSACRLQTINTHESAQCRNAKQSTCSPMLLLCSGNSCLRGQ